MSSRFAFKLQEAVFQLKVCLIKWKTSSFTQLYIALNGAQFDQYITDASRITPNESKITLRWYNTLELEKRINTLALHRLIAFERHSSNLRPLHSR